MQGSRLSKGLDLLPELLLMLLVLAGLANVINHFITRGYLPQPFIFDVDDTFMDWFNTAYYAHNRGAFDIWHTVYPPLSFVFLKIFSLPQCYLSSPVFARDCDWLSRVTILGFYLADVVLAGIVFRRLDPRTAVFRTVAFGLGLPTLFALERGNLIVACLAFFIVAHSPFTRSGIWRWLAVALTVNFKPYLLLPVLPLAIKRNWRALELAGIATLIVYILTMAAFDSGTPYQVISNTINWIKFTNSLIWEQIYYSTSYAPFLQLDIVQFPVRDFLGSRAADMMAKYIPIIIMSGQIVTLACIVGAWLQPNALSLTRLSALLLAASLSGQSPGGYTETFLVYLVFMERWRGPGPIVALIATYLLCIPYDWTVSNFFEVYRNSWLSGGLVYASFGLAVGHFIRPGLIIILLWGLALDSLALILRAHWDQRPTFGLQSPADPKPIGA